MSVIFRPRRLGHINLYVENLERSLRFYEDVCGIERVRIEAQINAGFLSNGNTHHDVGLVEVSRGADRYGRDGKVQIQATRGTRPGLNHLGWEMESEADLVEAYKRLIASDASPLALYDHIISRAVYVADPDGNMHEFYADSIPNWRAVFNLEHDDLVTSQWDPLSSNPSTEKYYDTGEPIRLKQDALVKGRHLTGAMLATRRFDEMVRFMSDVAGLTLTRKDAEHTRRAVFGGTCRRPDLVLVEASGEMPTGIQLFSLVVDASTDMARASDGLKQHGIAVECELKDTIRHALVVRDPDGVPVELYRPYEGAWLESLPLVDHSSRVA